MSGRAAKVWGWLAAAAGSEGMVSMSVLCRAAVDHLGVSGASVTATTRAGVRAPISASDEWAAEAEELQFTVGEGPCAGRSSSTRPC